MAGDEVARTALVARWDALAEGLGWGPRAAAVGEALIDRYGSADRHYHDERHLLMVLEVLDELSAPSPPPVAAQLAAWFHDAIYTGRAGEDEDASADLARRTIAELGSPPSLGEAAASIVAATASHATDPDAGDEPTRLLLDADLAVLGSDPETYEDYRLGVRAEYAEVPDEAFRVGRLAVIDGLLQRRRLYLTDRGAERFEERARTNLRRERDLLSEAGRA